MFKALGLAKLDKGASHTCSVQLQPQRISLEPHQSSLSPDVSPSSLGIGLREFSSALNDVSLLLNEREDAELDHATLEAAVHVAGCENNSVVSTLDSMLHFYYPFVK